MTSSEPSSGNPVKTWVSRICWLLFGMGCIFLTVFIAQIISRKETSEQGARAKLIPQPADLSSSITAEDLQKVVASLSRPGGRLVGRVECRQAAGWVENLFRSEGLSRVSAEGFPVCVPGPAQAWADLPDGSSLTLHAFWPNGVMPPVLDPAGEKLRVVHVGNGASWELAGKEIEGSAVILDIASGRRWLDLAGLGARLVLFPETDRLVRLDAEDKVASAPIDMPRFWVKKEDVSQLLAQDGSFLTFHSSVSWQDRMGWNISGWMEGTEPGGKDDPVVLAAFYDSCSVVPDLSPGADQASSMACLATLLRVMKERRPARSILFLATSSHCWGLQGMRTFVAKQLLTKKISPALVICLDLSSGGSRIGGFFKGALIDQDERNLQSRFAELGRVLLSDARALEKTLKLGPGKRYVDGINNSDGKNWRCYIPGQFAGEHELVNMTPVPAICLATVDDGRRYWDTPIDTFDRVRWPELLDQVRFLSCLLPDLINRSGPFLKRKPEMAWSTLIGRTVSFDMKASYVPDSPIAGALVAARGPVEDDFMSGIRGLPYVRTNAQGLFEIPGVPSVKAAGEWRGRLVVEAFRMDPVSGKIDMAPNLGPEGAPNYPLNALMDFETKEITAVLFPCATLSLYDLVDQRTYLPFQVLDVYDAGTNSSPFEYGYTLTRRHPCATVYARPGTEVRVTMGIGPVGRQLVLLNGTAQEPLGNGYKVGETRSVLRAPFAAARDLWNLNEERLQKLKSRGVANALASGLHEVAVEHLKAAEKALLSKDYGTYLAQARAAWSTESRAYPDVLSTTNDVVKGALFHLFLLLPFSYFCERLLVGTRTLDKTIVATMTIFFAIFMVYRYIHPAFALTLTPFIVLLAFIIGTLSILVIIIVIQKFEQRLKEMKTESMGVHQADLERLSAALVAFTLGISSMRRRQVRTGLTCGTIVLLTFTILSFTSVQPELKRNEVTFARGKSSYQGLLIRDRLWSPLLPEAYESLREEMGSNAVIAPRAWYYSALVGQQSFIELSHPILRKSVTLSALLGLSEEEQEVSRVKRSLVAGRWVKNDAKEILIPTNVAWDLGIQLSEVGQVSLRLLGLDLPVVGIFDPSRIKAVPDLDGELITPVDHLLMSEKRREEGEPDPNELERYVHMAPEAVAVLPFDLVQAMGGPLYSVALRAQEAKDIQGMLEKMMSRIELTIFACEGDEVKLYSTIGSMGMSGARSLVIPILLASLIVLNTMLGSVAERTKEIGVYSSVGLAPSHVGSLFLAEASVYALMGGVGGFIMGQMVAKLFVMTGILGETGINCSSMSAVGITALVMGIVLLSAIYPARMASRIAVPALERQWRIPKPEGDEIVLDLPFTVSGGTAMGILGYLYEFLAAHVERSVGHFATENVILQGTRKNAELVFDVWLAPFDLGVSQTTTIEALPEDEDGFRGMRLKLTRRSGDEASWISVNRTFINGLRKQFLIWRTLRVADRERYTQWVLTEIPA